MTWFTIISWFKKIKNVYNFLNLMTTNCTSTPLYCNKNKSLFLNVDLYQMPVVKMLDLSCLITQQPECKPGYSHGELGHSYFLCNS